MEYSVIIETDSYSGNFEREMCAFITGQTGECEVGREKINSNLDYSIFEKDEETIILQKPDEHGCYRPVNIFFNEKSKKYTDVQIHFDEKPSSEMLRIIKDRAIIFDHEIKIKAVYCISTQIIHKRIDL